MATGSIFLNVPLAVARRTDISQSSKLLYGYLNTWTHTRGACVTRDSIVAEAIGLSGRQVQRCKRELTAAGLITVKPRFYEGQQLADQVAVKPLGEDDARDGGDDTDDTPRDDKDDTPYKRHSVRDKTQGRACSVPPRGLGGEARPATRAGGSAAQPLSAQPSPALIEEVITVAKMTGIPITTGVGITRQTIADYMTTTGSDEARVLGNWQMGTRMVTAMLSNPKSFFAQKGVRFVSWYFSRSRSDNQERRGKFNLDLLLDGVWGWPALPAELTPEEQAEQAKQAEQLKQQVANAEEWSAIGWIKQCLDRNQPITPEEQKIWDAYQAEQAKKNDQDNQEAA